MEQKQLLNKDLQCSNYVYNKTVKEINKGGKIPSKMTMRDRLVTQSSRKGNVLQNKLNSAKAKIEAIINTLRKEKKLKSLVKAYMIKMKCWQPIKVLYDYNRSLITPIKNENLKPFELETHKSIRQAAVEEAMTNYFNCCDAIKSNRIKFFELKYRSKKVNGMAMALPKDKLKIENGVLRFTNKTLSNKIIHTSKRDHSKLKNITSLKDCRMTYKNGVYRIHIPLDVEIRKNQKLTKVIGIDPGVSTFLSCYTPEKTITIKQSSEYKNLDNLKAKLFRLRKDYQRKRIRKRTLTKIDRRKSNLTDELHWKSILYLVKNYDIIFIEKFDSQGFVKGGKSKNLNRDTNNLKPFQFRQKLLFKARQYGKIVEVVKAHNTTKTCSNCGSMKKMTLKDREYDCKNCNQILDRDFNAAKNIILKGLLC